MVIAGFNKLTLIDFPHHVACIVFFAGCNFRCPFCHNSEIASACTDGEAFDTVPQEEIFEVLSKRKGILEGVVLSGGEPLINDLVEITLFIERIRALDFKVKLDTNGSFPQELKTLLDRGLIDYVAMDIKNSPQKYSLTAGREVNLDDINKSISIIKNSGVEYEFRTTLVKEFHTAEDLEKIGLWLKGEKNYFLQGFVNSGQLFDNSLSALDMDNALKIISKYIPNAKIR